MHLLPKSVALALAGLTIALVATTANVATPVDGAEPTATPKHHRRRTPTPTPTATPTRTPQPFLGYHILSVPVATLAPAPRPQCNGCQ
jgi:hypothetical protein